jgi:DNA invertase Pin-like site-specific DNA recombinase
MKAAIYLRASTDKQTTRAQRQELREICKRRGWNGVVEYEDVISGAKFTRVGLDKMMSEVRRGRLDVVLCYKLDRLGRSLVSVAQLIGEMIANKVALVIPGQGIDTSSDNSAAKFQMNILMAVAEFERDIIRERTLAGLAAARARGTKLGRPALELSTKATKTLRRFMQARGNSPRPSVRSLAAELGVSVGKAHALTRGFAKPHKPELRRCRKISANFLEVAGLTTQA